MSRILSLVVGGISRGGMAIGMVLVFLMIVHVSVEVVSRVVFRFPLPATIEIVSLYYMIAVAFVPLGYVQDKHEHLVADAIANVVPSSLRRRAAVLGVLLSIVVTGVILYSSVNVALTQTRVGEAVWTVIGQIPTWPSRWLPAIGFAALLLLLIHQLFIRGDIIPSDTNQVDEIDQA